MSTFLKIVTPEARLSFPSLFVPTAYKGKGDPKYQATLLFPRGETDMKELVRLYEHAIFDRFPGSRPESIVSPFKNGDERTYDGYAGMIAVTAKQTKQPRIVDEDREPVTSESVMYAGCYVRAVLTSFVYESGEAFGVGFTLLAIQKLREGEKFGGDPLEGLDAVNPAPATSPADDFAPGHPGDDVPF